MPKQSYPWVHGTVRKIHLGDVETGTQLVIDSSCVPVSALLDRLSIAPVRERGPTSGSGLSPYLALIFSSAT